MKERKWVPLGEGGKKRGGGKKRKSLLEKNNRKESSWGTGRDISAGWKNHAPSFPSHHPFISAFPVFLLISMFSSEDWKQICVRCIFLDIIVGMKEPWTEFTMSKVDTEKII